MYVTTFSAEHEISYYVLVFRKRRIISQMCEDCTRLHTCVKPINTTHVVLKNPAINLVSYPMNIFRDISRNISIVFIETVSCLKLSHSKILL